MPEENEYVYHLANGDELVLVGDVEPSDTDVEAAARQAGVRSLLVNAARFPNHPANRAARAEAATNPATVAAADLARRGVIRAGEQLATSPNLGRVLNAVSGPVTSRAVSGGIGAVVGGMPGAVVGAAIPSETIARGGARLAERGIRSGAGFFARLAASPLARRATGLPGVLASVLTDTGQPRTGPIAEQALARQRAIEAEYRARQPQPTGARNSLFARLLGAQ